MTHSDLIDHWVQIRAVFLRSQNAGLCHSFATINCDGTPNVTPIGSLVLDADKPQGYYFDVFNQRLGENLKENSSVAILAVDNRKLFWLKSVLTRRFNTPPAIRLVGNVGAKRIARDEEVQRCLTEVKPIKYFGAAKKFTSRLKYVRDIHFTRADTLRIGALTRHLHYE